MCHVHEVGAVRDNVFALFVGMLFAFGVEGVGVIVEDGWIGPFALRFEE
jgi:hypothetical protein